MFLLVFLSGLVNTEIDIRGKVKINERKVESKT